MPILGDVPSNQTYANIDSPVLLFVNIHPGHWETAAVTISADLSGNVTLTGGVTCQFLTLLKVGTQLFLRGAGSGFASIDIAHPTDHATLRSITMVG